MATSMTGLPAFADGEVDAYIERMNSYFIVSKTKDEHKVHVLIAGLPTSTYGVLRDLCSPQAPSERSYDELTKLLREHYGGSMNVILERQKFRLVERKSDEKVSEYMARLRRAARGCEFKTNLGENLVEQFRRGINNAHITSCLVRIENKNQFDLDTVLRTAVEAELYGNTSGESTESASNELRQVSGTKPSRYQSTTSKKDGKNNKDIICFRCNRKGHVGSDPVCRARDKTCNSCNRRGHFSGSRYCNNSQKVNVVEDNVATTSSIVMEQDGGSQLFTVGEIDQQVIAGVHASKAPQVQLKVAGQEIRFLVDSGACANIIDMKAYKLIEKDVTMTPTTRKLFAFGSNAKLDLKGELHIDVACAGKVVSTILYVFDGITTMCLLSFDTAKQLGILSIDENAILCNVQTNHSDIVSQFPKVFHGVGKLKNVAVKFHVDETVKPVAQPVRRLPFGYRDKVKMKIDELLAQGIIEPVEGVGTSWVSPLVCVMKDSGEIRQTIDMRQANKAILRERHPVPTLKEMLAGLDGAKVFSKLDLNQGFHQIELDPASRDITTFITPFGLYRYRRLIQGANASPEIFQHVIRQALTGLAGVQNLADDIILHGCSVEEHDKRLFDLLTRLEKIGLTLNEKKCVFRMPSIDFLGFVISSNGVSADPSKVESIVKFRRPENATDCRSFLGLVNFVGRFLPDLATISEPLRQITRKDQGFKWGSEQQKAFELIKKKMSQAQTLAHFDSKAKIRVVADASPYGLGAILIQSHGSFERVVSYAHRSLSLIEKKYSQTEKEALALVWACEKFMMYLLGTEFELVTDHKPLDFIFNNAASKPSPRIERWALRLQSFRYKVIHKPGKCNLADPLSRLSVTSSGVNVELATPCTASVVADQYINMVARQAVPCALSWAEIASESKRCSEIQCVVRAIEQNDFRSCPISYQSIKDELSICGGVLLRNCKIVMPVTLRPKCVELAHEGHQGIVKCKQRLRTKLWWPRVHDDVEKFCRSCVDCVRVSTPDAPEPMTMTKLPNQPWHMLSCDLVGPLPDGRSVIAVIDYYSRYFECAFLSSTTAERVIEFLDTVFARFGYPETLRTDNGPQFVSDAFQQYLATSGINWLSTTPFWPRANGEIERTNRTLLKTLKIAKMNGRDMSAELRKFLVAYRSTPHSSTGVAPYTMLFGRDMKTKLPTVPAIEYDSALYEQAAENDAYRKLSAKLNADQRNRAAHSEIEVGDTVFLRQNKQNKLDPDFGSEKFVVRGKYGSDIVCEGTENFQSIRRNVSFAKKCPVERELNDTNSGRCSFDRSLGVGKEDPPPPLAQRSRAPPLRFGNPVSH